MIMHISTDKTAGLNPRYRASFATASRLLSCLVTESLLPAPYFPLHDFEATGFAVVLREAASSEASSGRSLYKSTVILAVILLRGVPIFKDDLTDHEGKFIGLLDPLDMTPLIFEIGGGEGQVEQDGVSILK